MPTPQQKSDRRRWRWPQFSLWEMLVVTALLALLYGVVASLRVEREEFIFIVIGSFILVWGLIC